MGKRDSRRLDETSSPSAKRRRTIKYDWGASNQLPPCTPNFNPATNPALRSSTLAVPNSHRPPDVRRRPVVASSLGRSPARGPAKHREAAGPTDAAEFDPAQTTSLLKDRVEIPTPTSAGCARPDSLRSALRSHFVRARLPESPPGGSSTQHLEADEPLDVTPLQLSHPASPNPPPGPTSLLSLPAELRIEIYRAIFNTVLRRSKTNYRFERNPFLSTYRRLLHTRSTAHLTCDPEFHSHRPSAIRRGGTSEYETAVLTHVVTGSQGEYDGLPFQVHQLGALLDLADVCADLRPRCCVEHSAGGRPESSAWRELQCHHDFE